MSSRRRFVHRGALTLGAVFVPGISMSGVADGAIRKLRNQIAGPVLVAGDELYEPSRRVASHNPTSDKHPALIVGPTSAQDVSRAILFAWEHSLPLAIQSGGHDVLGQSTVDGGVLIHMGLMTGIRPESERVVVGSGVRAGVLNSALGKKRLAVPLGCHPNVGVTGLTLGGGLGWLLGKHGVTCDHVAAFEVVLADGSIVRVSDEAHQDLFWAMKGGGGNFGVVTSTHYRTVPLDKVARGFMVFSAARLSDFMQSFAEFMTSIPRELVVELVLTRDPEPLINVTYCHTSPTSFRQETMASLWTEAPLLASHHDVVAYPSLTEVPANLIARFAPLNVPGPTEERFNYWRGASCKGWSGESIDALVASFEQAPARATIGIGHFIHGAALEVGSESSALVREQGSFSFFFNANWSGQQDPSVHMNWVDGAIRDQDAYVSPSYINYLSSNALADVKASYGPNYQRLSALKTVYNPDNTFRLNRNIPPA